MNTPSVQKLQSQIALLNEDERAEVSMFISKLISRQRQERSPDFSDLLQVIGVGESDVTDGAAEHDHYIYGTPKKHSPQ